MTSESQSKCQVVRSNGHNELSVRAFATAEAVRNPPLLAWAEPEPSAVDVRGRTGRRQDFVSLVRGVPSWPEDIALAEVRLFWEIGALHVVAAECGCQWARIDEAKGNALARRSYPVLTTRDPRDLARFGLGDVAWKAWDLTAVEYWNQGYLVAWRLTFSDGKEASHA